MFANNVTYSAPQTPEHLHRSAAVTLPDQETVPLKASTASHGTNLMMGGSFGASGVGPLSTQGPPNLTQPANYRAVDTSIDRQ